MIQEIPDKAEDKDSEIERLTKERDYYRETLRFLRESHEDYARINSKEVGFDLMGALLHDKKLKLKKKGEK